MNMALDDFNMDAEVAHLSNSVATQAQLDEVLARWRARRFNGQAWLGAITQAELRAVVLRMVVTMADVGTSAKTRYPGVDFSHAQVNGIPAGSHVSMDTLADDVKGVCTLRQFAAYYAPLYWNWANKNDSPPAYWQKKGYTYENRFCAFDFFFGVESVASIGGTEKVLAPAVTDNQRKNSQANSRVLIYRSLVDQAGFQTNIVEVTNGRNLGSRATLGLLPPAPSQNP